MRILKQVLRYKTSGDRLPLLSISRRVSDLAEKFDLSISSWTEEGLGKQAGFIAEFGQDLVISAEENLEYSELGTTFYGDSAKITTGNLEATQNLILATFEIGKPGIIWRQTVESLT